MHWDWFFYWLAAAIICFAWLNAIAPRLRARSRVLDWISVIPLLPIVVVLAMLDVVLEPLFLALDARIETDFANAWSSLRYRYFLPPEPTEEDQRTYEH